MGCHLINLIYYVNACCAILYQKCMGNGVQANDTIKILSVMTVCRNAFHNGAM